MSEEKLTVATPSETDGQKLPTDQTIKSESKPDFKSDPEGFLKSYIPSENKVEPDVSSTESSGQNQQNKDVLSRIEKEAYRQGWLPKEQYEGNPDNWTSATQYLKNGAFMDQYKSVNEELKRINAKYDKLLSMSIEQARIFAEKNAAEAKKKKMAAFEDRNLEETEKYEKLYNDYNEQAINYAKETPIDNESRETKQIPQTPMEITQFQVKNSAWFNTQSPITTAMSTFAGQLYDRLLVNHPEWAMTRRLGEVELEVKRQFPQMFPNAERDSYPIVEGKTPPQIKSNIPRFEQLDHKTQQIIDNFVDQCDGKLTREDYIKQLNERGVI